MNKVLKLYVVFLILFLIAVVYMERSKPIPISWEPTYSVDHKSPFGLYVLNQEIDHFFEKDTLYRLTTTPYEYFSAYYDVYYNAEEEKLYYPTGRAFVAIDHRYAIDNPSTYELLDFVANGNEVFLSMNYFSSVLLDTLKVGSHGLYRMPDKILNGLANPLVNKKKYHMSEGIVPQYFNSFDTLNTTILGYKTMAGIQYVNFIKVSFGLGSVYLHQEPAAFSNFHLLTENHYEYAQSVLSYIDSGSIFLYLRGLGNKYGTSNEVVQSPLRYILSQPALRWAWYFFLLGMLVFILFRAKRVQRVIPVIQPLKNTTVDFIKTIANLYYQEQDYHHIIDKKIIYFLDKIRRDYFMDTTVLDAHFINTLHQKTGKDSMIIEKLVFLIERHRKKDDGSSEKDLIEITNTINKIL